MIDADGSFYADGRQIKRRPERTETGLRMGCDVALVNEWVTDAEVVAQRIAGAMNQSDQF